jgi:hypothetical protein
MDISSKKHRRTQSSSYYDFKKILPEKLKENSSPNTNPLDHHYLPDSKLTREVLDKLKAEGEKTIVVENLIPSITELNKRENDGFFAFGKKTRNYSVIIGSESKYSKSRNNFFL